MLDLAVCAIRYRLYCFAVQVPYAPPRKDNRKVILFFVLCGYLRGVERRHYFVVMCQLSAAYVSKLPRATLSSHRKAIAAFLHNIVNHGSVYVTAHKKRG